MIYYILIFIAVFNVGIAFSLTKLYQTKTKTGLLTSLLFSLISAVVSVLFFLILSGFSLHINLFSACFAGGLAILASINSILGIKIFSLGKVSVYTLFMMLGGMLFPFLYGILFLNEKFTVCKTVGVFILLISLFMPVFGGKSEKYAKPILFFALCFVVFCSNGMVGVLTKAHQINVLAMPVIEFMALQNIIQFILMAIAIGLTMLFSKEKIKIKSVFMTMICTKNSLIIVGYALTAGIVNMLMMYCASNIPASAMYPIVTGGTVLITALFGRLFFKEKLTKPIIAGLAMTIVATVLFMF